MRQTSLGWALATASGCLWFLACPPFDASWLAWVAAVPALVAIERAPSARSALLLGFWAGVVESAGGFYWLIETLQRFAGFPWVAGALVLLLFAAARGLIFLLATWLLLRLRGRPHGPQTRGAPRGRGGGG